MNTDESTSSWRGLIHLMGDGDEHCTAFIFRRSSAANCFSRLVAVSSYIQLTCGGVAHAATFESFWMLRIGFGIGLPGKREGQAVTATSPT